MLIFSLKTGLSPPQKKFLAPPLFAGDENSKAVIKTKSHRFFRLKTLMWMLFFREARNFHIYSTRSDANVNECKILEQMPRIDDLWYDRL